MRQCLPYGTAETDVWRWVVCTQDVEFEDSKLSPETLRRSPPRDPLDVHKNMEPRIVERTIGWMLYPSRVPIDCLRNE